MSASPAKVEAPKSEAAEDASKGNAAGGGSPGGIKAWLPLIVAVVLMPGLAFAMTNFVILPKLQKTLSSGSAPAEEAESHAEAAGAKEHEAKGGGEHGKPAGEHGKAKESSGSSKGKVTVPMKEKVLVNVAGTMGTRYLVVNFALVGSSADLKGAVEENEAQLRDVTSGVLSAKTISDLEKPGARNLIRTELITAFNTALGGGMVQEIYFTEFAVQ
jgi:flagellar FliL protein